MDEAAAPPVTEKPYLARKPNVMFFENVTATCCVARASGQSDLLAGCQELLLLLLCLTHTTPGPTTFNVGKNVHRTWFVPYLRRKIPYQGLTLPFCCCRSNCHMMQSAEFQQQ
jgi:hypothetical protein